MTLLALTKEFEKLMLQLDWKEVRTLAYMFNISDDDVVERAVASSISFVFENPDLTPEEIDKEVSLD